MLQYAFDPADEKFVVGFIEKGELVKRSCAACFACCACFASKWLATSLCCVVGGVALGCGPHAEPTSSD
jgi:hypothetical protein